MKLCRFDYGRVGIIDGDEIVDVTAAARAAMSPDSAGDPLVGGLDRLREALARGGAFPRLPLGSVAFQPPVARPGKIIAAPVNYRRHVQEANADVGIRYGHTETDIGKAGLFLKAPSSLAGANDPLRVRFPDRRTDYEVELVVVIGRGGSDIARGSALDHVAGYCSGLDVTLRGPEDRSFRKSIDGYSVLGPWLVTADEAPDPGALALALRLNGEVRQSGNTADMVYDVPRLIEFASSFYTLHPGDLIFTGTPEGVGPLAPGDRIEAEVEGLGGIAIVVETHRAAVHAGEAQ